MSKSDQRRDKSQGHEPLQPHSSRPAATPTELTQEELCYGYCKSRAILTTSILTESAPANEQEAVYTQRERARIKRKGRPMGALCFAFNRYRIGQQAKWPAESSTLLVHTPTCDQAKASQANGHQGKATRLGHRSHGQQILVRCITELCQRIQVRTRIVGRRTEITVHRRHKCQVVGRIGTE